MEHNMTSTSTNTRMVKSTSRLAYSKITIFGNITTSGPVVEIVNVPE
jgi:hypothetical protein